MLLKNEIYIMEYLSFFSHLTNFKIYYCKILPDENLFIKYFVETCRQVCGTAIFINEYNEKRAFVMNIDLNDAKTTALELFMQNKLSADTLLAIM